MLVERDDPRASRARRACWPRGGWRSGRRRRPVARRPRRDAGRPRGVVRRRRAGRGAARVAARVRARGRRPAARRGDAPAGGRRSRSTAATQRLPLPEAHDEIRRLGETLNEMLDRLRRSFERERRFVADASHELRTPVAVIKAELEAALRAGGHDPQVREALVAAVEECDHLAQLAEDLLVVARAGEGGLPVRPERARRRASCSTRSRRASATAPRERGRAIRSRRGDGASVSTRTALRLRQALGNLVDNALRHGDGRDRAARASRRRRRGARGLPTRARASTPTSPSARSSASRAATAPAPAAAPGSGSRSCGRSPRRTAAAPSSSPGAGATVRIWLPTRRTPPQGHLRSPP